MIFEQRKHIETPHGEMFSFSLPASAILMLWRIVVSASLQNRVPFYRQLGFPEFEGSDYLRTKKASHVAYRRIILYI